MNILLTNEEIDLLYRLDYGVHGFSRVEGRVLSSSLPIEKGLWHIPDEFVERFRVVVAAHEKGGEIFSKMEEQTVRGKLNFNFDAGYLE